MTTKWSSPTRSLTLFWNPSHHNPHPTPVLRQPHVSITPTQTTTTVSAYTTTQCPHNRRQSAHTKAWQKPYKDKSAMTAYCLIVISIYNKKSVPVNQWFPHTTHNCVSATAEPINTVTDRTPTLQRTPSIIHVSASATRSVQHQSNTRTSYKTFISNATRKYRSVHPDRDLNTPYGPHYI